MLAARDVWLMLMLHLPEISLVGYGHALTIANAFNFRSLLDGRCLWRRTQSD